MTPRQTQNKRESNNNFALRQEERQLIARRSGWLARLVLKKWIR